MLCITHAVVLRFKHGFPEKLFELENVSQMWQPWCRPSGAGRVADLISSRIGLLLKRAAVILHLIFFVELYLQIGKLRFSTHVQLSPFFILTNSCAMFCCNYSLTVINANFVSYFILLSRGAGVEQSAKKKTINILCKYRGSVHFE